MPEAVSAEGRNAGRNTARVKLASQQLSLRNGPFHLACPNFRAIKSQLWEHLCWTQSSRNS